jgi:hypothetical protein
MPTLVRCLPDPLPVRLKDKEPPWGRHGFAIHSDYVEHLWLPVLGPTASWALRRLVTLADEAGGALAVDLAELGASLGLGGHGRHSPLNRALNRLIQFGPARWSGREFEVWPTLPPLLGFQLAAIPERLQRIDESARARLRAAAPTPQ